MRQGKTLVWININDRLPEPRKTVLVATESGLVIPAWLPTYQTEGRVRFLSDTLAAEIHAPTHWMPLPEPPKEDK